MSGPPQYKWFFETTTPVEGHMHAIARTIATRQTKFQFMEIFETHSYGKVLVLDGRIQSSEHDEFIYHEILVQPGLLAHPKPVRAMVIGGGEGATVREILRHPSITDCLMVDIDGEVVEECKKHLPEMHKGAFEDPRTRVLHEDAPVLAPYQGFISCFGTPWGFILASKGTDPRAQTAADIDRLISSRMNPDSLGYWNGTAHLHSFNLPKFLTQALDKNTRIITDKHPLIVS